MNANNHIYTLLVSGGQSLQRFSTYTSDMLNLVGFNANFEGVTI